MSSRPRLDSLTGLRFFAALLVVWRHGHSVGGLDGWLGVLAGPGYVGVSFFFVLSGFVLMWSYRPAIGRGRFWLHRFARVWPSHALTFVVALLVLGLASPSWYPWEHSTPVWGAVANLLLLQAWIPAGEVQFGVNAPAWSLSTEAFFYAAFPALVLLVSVVRRPRLMALMIGLFMLVIGIGVAASASGDDVRNWLYVLPLYRVGEFVVGMLLAVALVRGWRPKITLGAASALAVGSYVACATLLAAAQPFIVALVMLPSVAVLICATAARDLEGRASWLSRRAVVRLGEWSFALYLVHYTVLAVLQEAGVQGLTALLICLAVSVPLSALLFTRFERPVERWLRSLPDRRAGQLARLRERSGWAAVRSTSPSTSATNVPVSTVSQVAMSATDPTWKTAVSVDAPWPAAMPTAPTSRESPMSSGTAPR